jgi:hypothetical protein
MGMTAGQRAVLTRAINRFEAAVHEYAFIETIPFDSKEALIVRESIKTEFYRSRECLENLVKGYLS